MRILSPIPEAPAGYAVMSQCHGCDEYVTRFLLADNGHDSIMCICFDCVTKLAEECLRRYGDVPISQA